MCLSFPFSADFPQDDSLSSQELKVSLVIFSAQGVRCTF